MPDGPSSPIRPPAPPAHSLASLEGLPDDVLAHVFEQLEDHELVHLRSVSRTLDARVRNLGIPLYLTHHPVAHRTLHPPASSWPSDRLLALNGRISRALSAHTLHAVQVGPEWRQPVIPTMCLRASSPSSPSSSPDGQALVLGVGTQILVHPLLPRREYAPGAVGPATTFALGDKAGSSADIVGIHALPSSSAYIVAQFDGTLQRVELGPDGLKSTAHYMHPRGSGASSPGNIHSLAGDGDTVLTASTGSARLFNTRSPWTPPSLLSLGAGVRAWSAALSSSSSTPRAFLGLSGGIHTYSLRPSGPESERILHGAAPGSSAAYAVVPPTARSAHPSTLLSAWYDGAARLHDLRAPSPAPVLELSDPWSDTALYSAAFVGEHGVAGGGAQHGAVSVWDIRRPDAGWSVFSPSGRGSPVYALLGDGGRVWGVTEKRAFVLAFDGSGRAEDGIVVREAKAQALAQQGKRGGAKDVPNGYARRGGKFKWTVHYGEHAAREVSMGYRHGDRGMALFETEVPA